MSALQGSISIRRYRVAGAPPINFRDVYTRSIRAHALVPLDPQRSPEDRAVGWCSLHEPTDLDLRFDKYWLDGRIALALRVDVIRPPAQELRRLLAQRQREEEAKRKAPLPKAALRELKARVTAELRRRTPPQTRTTDLLWCVQSRRLYFFSQSKGPNELLGEIFPKTFALGLDVEGPGAWAADLAQGSGMEEALRRLRPTAPLLGGFAGLRPDARVLDDLDMMAAV